MTEHVPAEQLALYTSGDLAADVSREVATHISRCPLCQSEVAELRDTHAFIAGSLRDPVPEDLAIVRERLRTELQLYRKGGQNRSAWWLAGAAAALGFVVLVISFHDPMPVARRAPPLVARSMPALRFEQERKPEVTAASTLRPRRKPVRERRDGIRTVTLVARGDEPTLLKMTTADPNVVILWQSNERTMHE
jgi:anti-sigma factor RsiW